MAKLNESDLLTKWLHLAEKLIPPQAELSPHSADGGFIIAARWKDETNPDVISNRGVDLFFPREMIDRYLVADAVFELKLDAFIEDTISKKLQHFDPYAVNSSAQVERWMILAGPPS